ncbi:magnesium transporter [Desulfonatronospira sp. MSAO_Bac3]|uniref:magnesium transporter n=1 Tax=Desulfonatronospira sp. MSAO_Bac3 TaxID=2293857 RepID=UPI000FEFB34C|nr:magnesium transporter [Desulfonatronospira sp. MSAO_Bac3]RQD76693.1 MAG: magnesium transporter [Desulfonatronospira sp. MSAO_Bac3]
MDNKILIEAKDFLDAALDSDDQGRQELISRLESLLEAGDHDSIRDFFYSLHPADGAQALELFSPEKACAFITLLNNETQAQIFNYLPPHFETRMASCLGRAQLARIIGAMSHDERADLYNRLTSEQQEEVLPALAHAEREDIRRLASYSEGTAGAVMTSDYAALSPDITAREALDKLRREAPDKETIYQCYVIDENRRLVGVISLRELLVASPRSLVSEVMNQQPIFAHARDNAEEVASTIAKYDLMAMPIINGDDKLVGIVTFDDVHDILEEEATEDFHRMGSISGHGESLVGVNFREASPWLIIQKRLPWLLALVFVNLLSGAGIAFFENTIEAVVALVFFLPLLIASAGNAGSQSSTLMVRALATGDVKASDWLYLLGKEVGIALTLGLGMALAVSMVGIFRGGPEVAIVVGLTMTVVVLFGSLVGCLLPFLLARMKVDPATASVPLITSIADIGGILIYFSIATWLLEVPAAH